MINALRKKSVCKVAPIPGETKVWQYITLTKRIYLIDCPGVVYNTGDSETETVLKGVVRAEKLNEPDQFVEAILERTERKHLVGIYGVEQWADAEEFVVKLAERQGRLWKGGEADVKTVAK